MCTGHLIDVYILVMCRWKLGHVVVGFLRFQGCIKFLLPVLGCSIIPQLVGSYKTVFFEVRYFVTINTGVKHLPLIIERFYQAKYFIYYWNIFSQIWKVKVNGLTWFHFYVNLTNVVECFLWITSSKHHVALKGLFTNVVLFKVGCNIFMLQIQCTHEKTRKKTRWNSVQMPLVHAYVTIWQTFNCKDSSSTVYVS